MGQGRASVFSRLIAPKKAKEKEQAKAAAREEKHKKQVAHYVLINPDAFRDTSEYREAAANAIGDKQRRTLQRARMCTVDKPPIAVSGSTVLLPNTTFPAGAWVWEDVGGVQSRTWRLGDGGAAELILLGVDPRSLTAWMDAFSTSRIKCVIPGQPGPGAPIFASARIVQRTTEAGRALQPVAEVTKAIVMSAPALVAPLGHVAPMGEMLQSATGFVRDSAATAADMAKRSQGTASVGERKTAKALASARQQVAQKLNDPDFGLQNADVSVGIVFSIAGEPGTEIGRGLWSFGDTHSAAFQGVMKRVHDLWSGA